MAKGIIGQIQFFGTVVFAATIGMMGVDFFFRGDRLLGAGFVLFAILMVAIEEYVTKPTDVAADAAKETVGKVVKKPDEELEEKTE